MQFDHYLVTKFNIRPRKAGKWDWDKKNNITGDAAWLNSRFQLFEKYCLPSVLNQANKKFDWIIFFDSNTPDDYKAKVESYKSKCEFIVPIYIKDSSYFDNTLKDYILRNSKSNKVITTRLDNDDAIHREFIADIQKIALKKNGVAYCINPASGLHYDIRKGVVAEYFKDSGPFISLIENREKIQTVFCDLHDNIIYRFETLQLTEKKFWVQVIHERNLSNRLSGFPYLKQIDFKKDFGINGKRGNLLIQMGYIISLITSRFIRKIF